MVARRDGDDPLGALSMREAYGALEPEVLVLGPIAVGLAHGLHLNPDTFLMAVATGASSDFLTPIGHQCNTLLMVRAAIALPIAGGWARRCPCW
jgi:hypothetical protein